MNSVFDGARKGVSIGFAFGMVLVILMYSGGCLLLDPPVKDPRGQAPTEVVAPAASGYVQFDVGGMILCAPQDSTVAPGSCYKLPDGLVLLLPKISNLGQTRKATFGGV